MTCSCLLSGKSIVYCWCSLHALLSCTINCLIVGSILFFFFNSIELILGLSSSIIIICNHYSKIDLVLLTLLSLSLLRT